MDKIKWFDLFFHFGNTDVFMHSLGHKVYMVDKKPSDFCTVKVQQVNISAAYLVNMGNVFEKNFDFLELQDEPVIKLISKWSFLNSMAH